MPVPTSPALDALLLQRQQLMTEIAQIGDMRPGSLVERYRKCGKLSCRCAKPDSEGHGPCFSLTHAIDGKTVTRVIPAGPAVDRARQQLEEYHRFRQLVQQVVSVSERICDLQLRSPEREAGGVKKNFARRSSRR